MGFLIGVLFGIVFTLAALYLSIAYLRYEPPRVVRQLQEPSLPTRLYELLNKRDDWLNYLIAFIYRELCYSDALHQFAVKKINVELEEVKDSSKKVLQKLALKDYEFGSVIPIFSRFRLTEPEGIDCDAWTDSISIEFDLEYDVGGAQLDGSREAAPVQVSAECWPILFSSSVTVMIKIFKIKGRARLHLTRKPFPYWYISFMEKPELDFRVETNLNNRYSKTIENLFASHMIRMVQRRHTVPNFKLRQSPLFSNDHFELRFRQGDPECELIKTTRTELSITAKRGRGFPCLFNSATTTSSCCFVTFLVCNKSYAELQACPDNNVSATQTEFEVMGDFVDEAAGSRSFDSIAEMQEKEEQLDEFVNITVGKKKNIALADDETEGDIVESGENLSPQVGKESKRAKLFGLARNLRDHAKELPVLRNRKAKDAALATGPGQTSSPRKSDQEIPPLARTKSERLNCESSGSLWNIISSQKRFYRTKVAMQSNNTYQWRYQTFKTPISTDLNSLLIGVWEKPHGVEEPNLLGIAEIPIDTILLKATQTLSKSFQRKVKLSQPPNFVEESFRAAVGAINTNRGFRPEFAIGDLTLEFGLSIEKETSLPKTTSNVQTEYEKGDVQNTAQQVPVLEPSSRGRLFGNIRNKFWNEKQQVKTEASQPSTSSRSAPKPIISRPQTPSRDSQNEAESDEVEVGTPVDDREVQMMSQVHKYQPGLVAKNHEDMLAVLAKAEGSKIFSDLPDEARQFALEKEISKIEDEIEAELGRKHLMQLELQNNPDSISLENNIKKCAERVTSLQTLLMTYTSAMQDTELDSKIK